MIGASCMQEYFENTDRKSTAVDMYRFAQSCFGKVHLPGSCHVFGYVRLL